MRAQHQQKGWRASEDNLSGWLKNSFDVDEKKPSSRIKNALKEVRVPLSAIKRHLCQCKHRGFTSRWRPLVTLKNRKASLDLWENNNKKTTCQVRNKILWTDETKKNLEKRRYEGGGVVGWVCMADSGTQSLVFIYDRTEPAGWSLKCTELYFLLRFSHRLQTDSITLYCTDR